MIEHLIATDDVKKEEESKEPVSQKRVEDDIQPNQQSTEDKLLSTFSGKLRTVIKFKDE